MSRVIGYLHQPGLDRISDWFCRSFRLFSDSHVFLTAINGNKEIFEGASVFPVAKRNNLIRTGDCFDVHPLLLRCGSFRGTFRQLEIDITALRQIDGAWRLESSIDPHEYSPDLQRLWRIFAGFKYDFLDHGINANRSIGQQN